MALQGLDRAVPPPAATAKKMLDSIDGQWWNVYIGGPEATNAWKPDEVRQYVQAGIRRFMLTYVGRQHRGPLTKAQGHADGREALAIAKAFGYSGKVPLCLDVELPTWEGAKQPTVEYTKAWCATVREGGARPGVYANPAPLKDMAAGKIGADFVWVASWVSQTAAKHDPHHVPQLPDELWAKPGMRAWQYAGAFNGKPCEVMGFNVDINVSDPGCLAGPPGRASGKLPAPSSSGVLRRGNRGKRVQLLTRRLAYLRSRRSGEPYLDEPRARFDAKTEDALEAFQREHRLEVDGVYGSQTAQALLRAIQHQRSEGKREPKKSKATLRTLIDDVRRHDAATDRAWERLAAYGGARRRQLARGDDDGERNGELADLTRVLLRIEQELKALVAVERRELALQEGEGEAGYAAEAYAAETPAAVESAEPKPRTLSELSDEELLRRVDRLDRALGASRTVLMRRYVAAERRLPRNGPVKPRPKPKPKPKPPKKPEPAPAQDDVRELQRELNRFADRYLELVGPLMVDGVKGPASKKRIRRIKYYLGYTGSEQRSSSTGPEFLRRLRHPRSARASNPAMLRRAAARRREHRKAAKAAAATTAGVATFDGRQVAGWLKPYLDWARANGWKGTVTSGWRSPEYSEQVCRQQCGAPSCPGTCAGRSSNHAGRVKPAGAVDVSDIPRFAALMQRCPHSPHIFNAIGAADPEHFSASGR